MNKQAFAFAVVALVLQPPTFRTRVEIVAVDVSVTRGDSAVADLTADDFVVTDDGIRQRVDTVTVARVPLSVTLVLDTSESVAGERLDALISASEQAVNELRTGDYVSLITFASVVARPVALTTHFDSVRPALRAITGAGDTTLRDAVFLGLQTSPPAGLFSNRPRMKQAVGIGQHRPMESCRNSSVVRFATCEIDTC
jgi:hypothetical protein